MISLPWWYYGIAAVIAAGLWIWKKNWAFGLLIGYAFFIFSATFLNRIPNESIMLEPVPFWSYHHRELYEQIIANIIAFIPLGIFAGKLFRWKGILIGASLSVIIEVLQLAARRGLFEVDDMIHNSLGTAVGVGVCMLAVFCVRGRPSSA